MPLTKGQKIQRAMERIINPKPKEPKGSGDMATTLPRKKENKLQNANNPDTA